MRPRPIVSSLEVNPMSRGFIERPRSFCALGGALLTAGAIPGVVPILHTAMGCAGSIYWTQVGSTGYLGAGYCGGLAVPSSNVGEKDIVFGGGDRLRAQIASTITLVEGELYFVLTGCMTDIIGDDIQSVIRDFREQGTAIIGAETGGFKGDAYRGYDLVLQALWSDFIEKKAHPVKGKVNLWGIVPGQDAFWRGNIENLRSLLGQLGLQVNSFFTVQDSLAEINQAGDAELNLVLSQLYGREAALTAQDIHGIPWLALTLPIGAGATREFLQAVGNALELDQALVESVAAREEHTYYRFIDSIADTYNDQEFQRYAVVVGDANYAPALTRFLADDLGWLPELTVITEEYDEIRESVIADYLDGMASGFKTRLVFETDASQIQGHLAQTWPRYRGQKYYNSFSPAFVVGSHWERELAKNIGAGHLSVTYPVGNRVVMSRGYTGYAGGIRLIEDLFSVLVAER